ncbi:MAG: hypothetical protein C4294_18620 [Nitrospiraceae bacterium]
MNEFKELETVISEIESEVNPKSDFAKFEIKEYFKSLMQEAGDASILLESISLDSHQNLDNKPVLDFATNVITRIHKISPEILVNLCQYTGFSQKQIVKVKEICELKEKSTDKSICHLFESTALELSLINYPKNKELLKSKKNNLKVNEEEDENTFDSFLRYLVKIGVPSQILENLASLTVYQKFQLQDDLKINFKLQNIYNRFVETGIINKDEIEYSKNIIYSSILKNLNSHPIQILNTNGYPVASYSDKQFTEEFFMKCSPSTVFDAWGVKDEMLLVYCMTNNHTFESQDIQIVRDAYGVLNGMSKGKLNGVKDFEMIALCNPLLGDDNEDYLMFNNQLKQMVNAGTISQLEYNSLKYAPVNKEMLNIIDNTADGLYEQIKGRISLGLHSDNSLAVKLKTKSIQVSTSISGIVRAIGTLKKISECNPTLHQIDSAFATYAKDMADGYRLAHAAFVNYSPKDLETKDLLDNAIKDLLAIKKTLISSNSRHSKSPWTRSV